MPQVKLHRDDIDPDAFNVVENLQREGFKTFFVGGCVRDLLLGLHPKDFDIATEALPQQVKRKIRGSYIIGKRFRLVLVKRGLKQYEVSTFRRQERPDEFAEGEKPFGDNIFGTPEEDALRRDFTVNALFYDPLNDQLIDYSKGLIDLENGWIRMIGNPVDRVKEDPIRILRGMRLANKLRFTIESEFRLAMQTEAPELRNTALPRRREEYLKILRLAEPGAVFHEMHDLGILKEVLPSLERVFESREKSVIFESHLNHLLHDGKHAEPTWLLGCFLLAYLRATHHEDPLAQPGEVDILDDPEFGKFMRDELGMFKLEQSSFATALEMEKTLVNVDSFQKRGYRRQSAFIHNECFEMALHFAINDHILTPKKTLYWRTIRDQVDKPV